MNADSEQKRLKISAITILVGLAAYGIYALAYITPSQNKRVTDCQRLVQIANDKIARMDQRLLGLGNVAADAVSYANDFNANALAIRAAQFAQFEAAVKNSDDGSTQNNCLSQ